MSVKENILKTKAQFSRYRARSIRAAFMGAVRQNDEFALPTLVALREALPEGCADFHDFEASGEWSAKKAYKVFDRAIAMEDAKEREEDEE